MSRDCYAPSPGDERQFVTHSLAMKKSPAWRALPDNARRLLDRLEVEHMNHRGAKNGSLIVTYDQLELEADIRRGSVKLAILQAVALGFLAVERQGYAAHQSLKIPSMYRLTYVDSSASAKKVGAPDPTNEWKGIKSSVAARCALGRVRVELVFDRDQRRANRVSRKEGKSGSSGRGATI